MNSLSNTIQTIEQFGYNTKDVKLVIRKDTSSGKPYRLQTFNTFKEFAEQIKETTLDDYKFTFIFRGDVFLTQENEPL